MGVLLLRTVPEVVEGTKRRLECVVEANTTKWKCEG